MKSTVCLNMIVKNESKIIRRCLESVKGIIDSWCIVDTGSTDDTREIIRATLGDLPGELIERPWFNFGENRDEALKLAKKWGDWLLLIDADMVLEDKGFDSTQLDKKVAAYHVLQENPTINYYNFRLLNTGFDWQCKGVTHEYYSCVETSPVIEKLKTLTFKDLSDGGSKENKFTRDISLLKKGLEDEPNNARYMFYLAQTYRDINALEDSIYWYKRRVEAGDWFEEVWYSMYMICSINLRLGNLAEAEYWCKKAYAYHPHRSEAIYEVCRHLRYLGRHKEAYEYYKLGKPIPYPRNDVLFITPAVYKYLFDYELTVLHYYLFPEKSEEGLRKSIEFLNSNQEFHNSVYSNLRFYLPKLIDNAASIESIDCDVPEGFTNSSPCKLMLSSGACVTNIRQVNYKIDKNDGSYHYLSGGHMNLENTQHDPVITKNYLSGSGEMKESYLVPYFNSHVEGLEDVRLFERDGKINFLATTKNLEESGKNRIAIGTYDSQDMVINVERIFDSPKGSDCEKNWVIFNEKNLIYTWSPLSLYDIDNLSEVSSFSTPRIFQHFRGSSVSSAKFLGLNWFVVHSVIHDTPRTYMHYLVALDYKAAPVAYSLPFTFEGEKIEYCLSINAIEDHFEFHYSTWDACSKSLKIPMKYFSNKVFLCS